MTYKDIQLLLFFFRAHGLKRQSKQPSTNELHVEQIKGKGRGRNSNHAPRAGKELTAGGSRTQTSIVDATGNEPSATSRVGSRAVAIELCKATESRLPVRVGIFVAAAAASAAAGPLAAHHSRKQVQVEPRDIRGRHELTAFEALAVPHLRHLFDVALHC